MLESGLSDWELIERVKNGCSESFIELNKRHGGIMVKTFSKYGANSSLQQCSGLSTQDFQDNRFNILYEAARNYNPEKGTKFVSYLGNSTRYYCLDEVKRATRYYSPQEEYWNGVEEKIPSTLSNSEEVELGYILEILEKLNDKRAEKVIKMHYFGETRKERSFANIAKKLKISPQGALDIHNRFIKLMKEKVKNPQKINKI